MLVAMTGYSGSGKSWLSKRLIPRLSAIRLRSDLERKRLAKLPPSADSKSRIGAGIYDRETTAAVYDHLLETAGDLKVDRLSPNLREIVKDGESAEAVAGR